MRLAPALLGTIKGIVLAQHRTPHHHPPDHHPPDCPALPCPAPSRALPITIHRLPPAPPAPPAPPCAGTGSDPRDRRFCTVSQGLRYDPQAQLVRAWLPELAALAPAELAHQPWGAPAEALAAAGVRLCSGTPEDAAAALAQQWQHRQQNEQQLVQRQEQQQEQQEEVEGSRGTGGGLLPAPAYGFPPAAAAAAAGGVYPLPMVDPATQISKGPKKQRQTQSAATPPQAQQHGQQQAQ